MKLVRTLPVLLLLAGCARPAEIPEEEPPLPVKLEKAARTSFQPTLTLLGVVRPAGEAEVLIPVPGRVRYPGRFSGGLTSGVEVRAGEVLARVYNADAEQDLAEARLRLEAAGSELNRYRKAFESGVLPEAQLAQSKAEADLAAQRVTAARQRQSSLDLRSPVSGWLLVERSFPAESEVQAGTVLARIAAGGKPKVEARAASADKPRLREGLAVRFVLPGQPGAAGRGVIREISPVLDAGGTVGVVAEVTEGAALPPPGEGIEVEVELDVREQTLTVPEDCLLVSEGGTAVYVVEGGKARRRSVTLGARAGGRVEVLTGLSPGDKLVVGGAALLTDGARVSPVEEPEGEGR